MKNSFGFKIIGQIVCIVSGFFALFPLLLMLKRSFDNGGINNYKKVLKAVNPLRNYLNSIIVVGATLIIVAVVISLAAYAFSKMRFRGSNILYFILLTGMMIPTAAMIFPLFQITKRFGLINELTSLMGPYSAMNALFNLLILKNYYDSLPNELIEAAKIDGASSFHTFARIILPLSIPGLALALIQTFLSAWNELQMGMTFINNPAKQTITVVPMRFAQTMQGSYPIEVTFACLSMTLAPIIVFYIFAQKFLIAGLTAGAVKG